MRLQCNDVSLVFHTKLFYWKHIPFYDSSFSLNLRPSWLAMPHFGLSQQSSKWHPYNPHSSALTLVTFGQRSAPPGQLWPFFSVCEPKHTGILSWAKRSVSQCQPMDMSVKAGLTWTTALNDKCVYSDTIFKETCFLVVVVWLLFWPSWSSIKLQNGHLAKMLVSPDFQLALTLLCVLDSNKSLPEDLLLHPAGHSGWLNHHIQGSEQI